jgi:hypothetical protein
MEYIDIAMFSVASDEVCFAEHPFCKYRPYGTAMVFDANPVSNSKSFTVEFWTNAAQYVGYLTRNELLDMLIRPIVITAV